MSRPAASAAIPEVAREPNAALAGDLARLRSARAAETDRRLQQLMATALGRHREAIGRVALVGVGGYGRGELSPYSDIDVVLLHEPSLPADLIGSLASALWYPLWDEGLPLDHAVRDTVSMRQMAAQDLRAATGMLDARHVAGEPDLTLALRSTVLADWRREAGSRLPALKHACARRADQCGDLAHAAVPDLKESRGGLRDGNVLGALVATWLVDVPHREGEAYRSALLDVRDALHEVAGRRGDRLHRELVPDVAARLGTTPEALSVRVRDLGRRTAHLAQMTWRRIDQVLAAPSPRPGPRAQRRPALVRLDVGIASVAGEVVLAPDARPGHDPWLALRAAVTAAANGLALAPSTAARLAAAQPDLPEPWPDQARRGLVRLLASGPALVPVWEELDQCGLVDRWLPEWGGIRLRVSESAVHRFTIDRHLVETCVEASRLMPQVSRPDLLVVAALLHDLGKHDRDGDHSIVGAPMAERVARRWGFSAADAGTVAMLVRHHLLLPETAVRRDIDDPVTLCRVAALVADETTLDLLTALTEADARAAAPAAWTSWRAGLVRRLVSALRATLAEGRPVSAAGRRLEEVDDPVVPDWAEALGDGEVRLLVEPQADGTRVLVAATDRLGLLADVSGALATAGLTVRAAHAAVHGSTAVSMWDVESAHVDQARLRLRLDRVLDGSVDLQARLGATGSAGRGRLGGAAAGPARPDAGGVGVRRAAAGPARPDASGVRVRVLPDVSGTATVLEVRAADQAALVWRLCQALADLEVDVRSAHLETLGPQAEDVAYVTDRAGRPLGPERAEQVRAAVQEALTDRAAASGG